MTRNTHACQHKARCAEASTELLCKRRSIARRHVSCRAAGEWRGASQMAARALSSMGSCCTWLCCRQEEGDSEGGEQPGDDRCPQGRWCARYGGYGQAHVMSGGLHPSEAVAGCAHECTQPGPEELVRCEIGRLPAQRKGRFPPVPPPPAGAPDIPVAEMVPQAPPGEAWSVAEVRQLLERTDTCFPDVDSYRLDHMPHAGGGGGSPSRNGWVRCDFRVLAIARWRRRSCRSRCGGASSCGPRALLRDLRDMRACGSPPARPPPRRASTLWACSCGRTQARILQFFSFCFATSITWALA
jgi:hypothetical protein